MDIARNVYDYLIEDGYDVDYEDVVGEINDLTEEECEKLEELEEAVDNGDVGTVCKIMERIL